MKLIKPVLWTVLGAVIGATAVLTADQVQAQQNPSAERIQVRPAWTTERGGAWGLFFVKDSRSGGCWMAAKAGGDWASLAVAPAGSCD